MGFIRKDKRRVSLDLKSVTASLPFLALGLCPPVIAGSLPPPEVIQGISPGQLVASQPSNPPAGYGYNDPRNSYDPQEHTQGALGGGFIEAVVNAAGGGDPPQQAPGMYRPASYNYNYGAAVPRSAQRAWVPTRGGTHELVDPRDHTDGALGGGFIEAVTNAAGGNFGDDAQRQAPAMFHPAAYGYAAPTQAMQTETLQREVDPQYLRTEVDYDGRERPGTIVIDTPNRYLYLVEGNGRAIRYGIGVGRPGFEWSGVKIISRKSEWPEWRPPTQMMQRRPDLPEYMRGGPDNPLGARALYLGSTLYRIHGTNEPWTIGHNVSSGCIRMMNADVIDLYRRVGIGTRVIVI